MLDQLGLHDVESGFSALIPLQRDGADWLVRFRCDAIETGALLTCLDDR